MIDLVGVGAALVASSVWGWGLREKAAPTATVPSTSPTSTASKPSPAPSKCPRGLKAVPREDDHVREDGVVRMPVTPTKSQRDMEKDLKKVNKDLKELQEMDRRLKAGQL